MDIASLLREAIFLSRKGSFAYYDNRYHDINYRLHLYERIARISMKIEKPIKIAFLGGDMRSLSAVKRLSHGAGRLFVWNVPSCTENERIRVCDNIYKAISGASAVVLPLPSSSDGVTLNCITDNSESKTALTLIADAVDSECIIIGGKLPKSFCDYAALKGIRTFDYFESEVFQIKNAYTTAEAALNIAMNNLSKNIRGSNFAITGYGRISKQLAKLLLALGGNVTVAARKESDITWAMLEGCNTVRLSSHEAVTELCEGYDIIFNTVPFWLFDEQFLKRVDKETLIIELASAPGGIDISEAKRQKSKVLWAASLPGKYAPESAGELISECIADIINTEVKQ